MKFILHVGMPKTASSAIQFNCKKNFDALIESSIYYPSDPVFPHLANNQYFLSLARSGDGHGLKRYLDDIAENAASRGCESILISHENLLYLPECNGAFEIFSNTLSNADATVSLVFTTRKWKNFFYSYALQTISTKGSGNWANWLGQNNVESLSAFLARMISVWTSMPADIIKVPYYDGQGIVERFFDSLNADALVIRSDRVNVRRDKSIFLQALVGFFMDIVSRSECKNLFDIDIEAAGSELFGVLSASFNESMSPSLYEKEEQIRHAINKIGSAIWEGADHKDRAILSDYF